VIEGLIDSDLYIGKAILYISVIIFIILIIYRVLLFIFPFDENNGSLAPTIVIGLSIFLAAFLEDLGSYILFPASFEGFEPWWFYILIGVISLASIYLLLKIFMRNKDKMTTKSKRKK